MHRISVSVLLLMMTSLGWAHTIDGPANLRTSPKGEIIISLKDKEYVTVINQKGQWYSIEKMVSVNKADFSDGKVKKGATLLYGTGVAEHVLGKNAVPFVLHNPKPSFDNLTGYLHGVIHKSNIRTVQKVENKHLAKSLKSGMYVFEEFIDLDKKTFSLQRGRDRKYFRVFKVENMGTAHGYVGYYGVLDFTINYDGVFSGDTCVENLCARSIRLNNEKSFSIDVNGKMQTFISVEGLRRVL